MLTLSDGRLDGAISPDGRVMGCYMHGLFTSDAYRTAWIDNSCRGSGGGSEFRFNEEVVFTLDALAEHIKSYTKVEEIEKLATLKFGRTHD